MARPLAALRDPSLLLPALLSAAARPLTSHSVLRATPPGAQRAATPRPPRRRDAAPRASTGPTACLPGSLALYSFSHCLPCQNTTRVTCPDNSQPTLVTSSAEAARARCYGNAAARRELEIGDQSSRTRVSEDSGTRRDLLHRAPKQPWNCAPSALGSPGRCHPRAYPRREDNYSFYSSTGLLAWRKRAGNPALNACNFPMESVFDVTWPGRWGAMRTREGYLGTKEGPFPLHP